MPSTDLKGERRRENRSKKLRTMGCENNEVTKKGGESKLTIRVVLTAVLSVLGGGFHFGFQISIINPMAQVLQSFLLENFQSRYSVILTESDLKFVWSMIAGSLFIGAAIGAFIMSKILEVSGPKHGILCSAVVLIFSTPLAGFSHFIASPELFVISRLLSGIGVGMGTTAQGVFLAEISPVAYRGVISSFGGFSTNIGFIFASALGLPNVFGHSTLWPYAYYIEAAPCLIFYQKILIMMNITWFHDSPVFLLRNSNELKTQESLIAYCGYETVHNEMQRVMNEVKTYSSTVNIVWDRAARRALMLSLTLNIVVSFRAARRALMLSLTLNIVVSFRLIFPLLFNSLAIEYTTVRSSEAQDKVIVSRWLELT
ncbi:hypothetical protein DICVIV_13764 [Dictyocaulus viviparus]|uniref:Major facilitator superfamily (MFS) profile domain-containing protein n=1 Tax=Dictyocaulus viviparus TaxID=29172 RepID=A0A0D8X6Y1_DICVI|nr:hypothetical protein DICVIV_13764 [Dictyocaulus viviparus]